MAAKPGLGILGEFPRLRLCRLPTPLEAMPNLGKALGGARVYVKRDDCTDLAFGGNKVRQLEFYLGEARLQGADTILITGAVQSNFVRLAAASARKSGMGCHIQLEERVPRDDSLYRNSGNVLLDRILGATLYSYPEGEDEEGADRRVGEIAEELKGQGRRPYIIPLGPGHPPLGALGYVVAARELLEQVASRQLSIDELVVPSGSGHTHGGLLFGLRALGSRVRVTGVCVRRNAGPQKERIRDRCREIAELLEMANPVADDDIRVIDDFLAPGYGRLNPPTLEAIRMAGSMEGLILDPVYTGKTMAGLIHRARSSGPGRSFVLMHTGGTPAIFAYGSELTAELGGSGVFQAPTRGGRGDGSLPCTLPDRKRKDGGTGKSPPNPSWEVCMNQLSEHLFRVEDTCSVYGVRAGGKTLLIDCGTDLRSQDAGAVDRVLLTHFHRDQCSGIAHWQEQGADVYIPAAERHFLQEADLRRAAYYVYDNYTAYYPGFAPLQDVRGAGIARDYETIDWQGIRFEVVPLPGHTFGSTGYRFEVDGQRVLACGDLMAAPGRLGDYHWLQWSYMDFQGHVNQLESLAHAAELEWDLMLPGHGAPFTRAEARIDELSARLAELHGMFFDRPYTPFQVEFRRLSPHVYEVNSMANSYVVKDDAGHAVLIDCGYVSGAPITANPHRYIDHLTPRLRSELGVETVEYFLPTHFHDDHLAGYPMLRARYGTKVVAAPELRDLLEHPEHYDMPCMVPDGMRVDRVVARGDSFHWRGIDFRIEQFPGQTWYDHHITFHVDGRRFLAIGDAISGLCFREERDYIHSFIPKNRTPLSAYGSIPRKIAERRPDVILTGHGGGVEFEQTRIDRWTQWMDRWQSLFSEAVQAPHPDMSMDPHWIEFRPYKVRIRPGDAVDFRLYVKNHAEEETSCRVRFRSVDGVSVDPPERELVLAAGETKATAVRVHFPREFSTHSLPVLADVDWNGRRLGEVAEAIAYW